MQFLSPSTPHFPKFPKRCILQTVYLFPLPLRVEGFVVRPRRELSRTLSRAGQVRGKTEANGRIDSLFQERMGAFYGTLSLGP